MRHAQSNIKCFPVESGRCCSRRWTSTACACSLPGPLNWNQCSWASWSDNWSGGADPQRFWAARAWYGCYGTSWLSSRWSSAYRQHCRINWFTEIPVFLCSSTSSRSIHSVKRTVLGMLVALNLRSRSGWNIDFTTLSALNYYKFLNSLKSADANIERSRLVFLISAPSNVTSTPLSFFAQLFLRNAAV